jgi:hypothetical protein
MMALPRPRTVGAARRNRAIDSVGVRSNRCLGRGDFAFECGWRQGTKILHIKGVDAVAFGFFGAVRVERIKHDCANQTALGA